MILHLLFPENIEPVFNNWARDKIVNAPAFRQYRGDLEDWDDILAAIRAGYSQEIGSDDFDFYDEQTRTVWVPQNQQPTTEPPLSEPNSEDRNGSEVNATSISLLTEVESTTHLSGDQLHEIETLLRSKKQIILEGPPGSGKTYVARLFARYLAGLPLEGEPDEHVEIVQFHQSYGYEDFVAGIRPVTGANGQLTYETRPGIFLEMCRRAAARPDDTFVLIIDEINRGNLSRIFGELLYGLEYRDQPVRMQYPVEVDGEPVEHLTIPDNLLLIGTMNSTDRSLAMIDYALRRRFYFWRLLPVSGDRTPVLKRWLDRQDALAVNQRGAIFAAFIELNESIEQLLGPDFQIGHSYFMLPAAELGDPGAWRRMWQYAIEPLLREYLHTRRDADVMIRDLQEQFLGRLTSDMFAAGVEETETAS